MSAENTKYDDTLFTLAKQSGGVQQFLNNITSFLRRRTDFFTERPNDEWQHDLLKVFHKEQAKLTTSAHIIKDTQSIKPKDKLKPNAGKGCNLPNYVWTQTLNDIELKIPMNCRNSLRARDVNVEINKKSLKVGLKGQTPLVSGELNGEIKYNESTWMLGDGNSVNLTLEKVNKTVWWDRLLLTDPAISLEENEPEKVKLNDMDFSRRETVEKMLENQHQKQLDLELPCAETKHKKIELFEKFKAMHPEMDFSKCKFNDDVTQFKKH